MAHSRIHNVVRIQFTFVLLGVQIFIVININTHCTPSLFLKALTLHCWTVDCNSSPYYYIFSTAHALSNVRCFPQHMLFKTVNVRCFPQHMLFPTVNVSCFPQHIHFQLLMFAAFHSTCFFQLLMLAAFHSTYFFQLLMFAAFHSTCFFQLLMFAAFHSTCFFQLLMYTADSLMLFNLSNSIICFVVLFGSAIYSNSLLHF